MGLCIIVGVYQDYAEDPECALVHESESELMEPGLAKAGLRPHVEPKEVDGSSWDMFGYGGLHTLRRLAAHVDAGRPLPPPAEYETAGKDPLIRLYSTLPAKQRPGLFARLFGRRERFLRSFDHLMEHSDCEGYYLPQDFEEVLFLGDDLLGGGMVGSSVRLLDECERLARALGLPDDIDSGSDEIYEQISDPDPNATGWRAYGYEAHACISLLEASRLSVETGCAIAFS